MDLKDKTIVITGAAQGLGQKMAEVLAGQGAKIALVDLDEAKLQETSRICADAGSEAKSYPADVAEEAAVEALFAAVRKDFGSVDGLINNAGTHQRCPVGQGEGRQGARQDVARRLQQSHRSRSDRRLSLRS